jgi:hypothetical protein
MELKLAEALLLRKELQAKVDRLSRIDSKELYETKTGRKAAAEGIDDIIAQVSKISFQQFTHCYDWHAKKLREVDAVIQQANWTTEVGFQDDPTVEYVDPYI